VPLGGNQQPVKVEIFGRTEILACKLPGSITPVVRDSVADKDYLRGFLDAIVLRILEDSPDAADYHVDVIPTGEQAGSLKLRRTFQGVDPGRAREYLVNLLTDLLSGPHAYLLPCEAAFAWISKQQSVHASVESMKENDRGACSSRYGPVPNFKKYDPPDENEAIAMINRRFGLFRESGGMA
jgi:exodeoxyribonuclease V gamma subunit